MMAVRFKMKQSRVNEVEKHGITILHSLESTVPPGRDFLFTDSKEILRRYRSMATGRESFFREIKQTLRTLDFQYLTNSFVSLPCFTRVFRVHSFGSVVPVPTKLVTVACIRFIYS